MPAAKSCALSPRKSGPAGRLRRPPINTKWSPPTGLKNVAGLDRPFALDVIVKDDFVDVCIYNRHTLFLRRDDYAQGDRLFFFLRKGGGNSTRSRCDH